MSRTPDEINNAADVIDSRDVIVRIEYLESERQDLETAVEEAEAEETASDEKSDKNTATACRNALVAWDASDEADELKALKALAEEAEGYAPDWKYGAALIRDSYFTEYAEELCKDIGDLPQNIPHYIEIDWQKTAENIRVDYTAVDFDGITYWVR